MINVVLLTAPLGYMTIILEYFEHLLKCRHDFKIYYFGAALPLYILKVGGYSSLYSTFYYSLSVTVEVTRSICYIHTLVVIVQRKC